METRIESTYDPVAAIKKAYFDHSDLELTFSIGAAQTGASTNFYSVTIDHEQVKQLIEENEHYSSMLITLLFTFKAERDGSTHTGRTQDSEYNVRLSQVLENSKVKEKFLKAYSLYNDIFALLGEEKKISLKFFRARSTDGVKAEGEKGQISVGDDYETFYIEFINTLEGRRKALISAVLHMIENPELLMAAQLYYPNKKDNNRLTLLKKNEFLLLASIYEIHDIEVLTLNLDKERRLGGANPYLLWDREDFEYSHELSAYKKIVSKYNTIFKYGDIPALSMCHDDTSPRGNIVGYRHAFEELLLYLREASEKDKGEEYKQSIFYVDEIYDFYKPESGGKTMGRAELAEIKIKKGDLEWLDGGYVEWDLAKSKFRYYF